MPTVDPIGSTTLSDAYSPYPKIAQLKDVASFRAHLAQLEIDLPVDERIFRAVQGSVLADPIAIGGRMLGNRWCIQPMEGWDAQPDGSPSEHTIRRWRNFGASGAKLIWGGEAAAVSPEARANPNQLLAVQANRDGLKRLLDQLLSAHQEAFGRVDDLLVGLQLTHSGRFCCPQEKNRAEPRIAYHHPLLDAKFGVDSSDSAAVLSDDELLRLIDRYLAAARLARDVGFHFVDIKACHGYLVHELLSARRRPGPFGGEYEGRTKFLLTIVERIRDELPDLVVGVRLSVFDTPPFRTSRQVGRAMPYEDLLPYEYGFGVNARDPMQCDLEEPIWLIRDLKRRGVGLVNLTCGSPYYNPHIQRPAIFPPSDGYLPPEDPLLGVWRQIDAARKCKQAVPNMMMVGSGYSYLQDYLPNVAQAVVRRRWIDFVGLGRMVLAYPELPRDALQDGALSRKRVCRTFSDCTTGPRNGLISGCFPLDPYYKNLPEAAIIRDLKQSLKKEPGPQ